MEGLSCWQDYLLTMDALDGMSQSGPVLFTKDIRSDFNDEVRSDGEEESVKCCMMESAERHAVRDNGFA